MAIINSLAVGKGRKSAGNITLATVKGRTIMREKPANVRNPRTPAQVAQRLRMSNLVLAWQILGSKFKKNWTVTNKYASAYNQFVSENMQLENNLRADQQGRASLVSGSLMLAKGVYSANSVSVVSKVEGSHLIKITNTTLVENLRVGDKIGIVFLNAQNLNSYVHEIELSEDDFSLLEDIGKEIDFSIPAGMKLIGGYYYSQVAGTSSTLIATI